MAKVWYTTPIFYGSEIPIDTMFIAMEITILNGFCHLLACHFPQLC